jgi:hypothetical protein
MRAHSFLWHYLWIAPHALQFIIAIVMVQRRLWREFPVFFAYTLFTVVEQGTLFILDHQAAVTPEEYWRDRWVFLSLEVPLRFAIVFEIFSSVFRGYPGLKQLTRILFRVATVVLLFAAIVVIAHAPDGETLAIWSGVQLLDLGVSMMQGGLLLLLVGFASYFGLSWRSPGYGFAFGLGIFASVRLANDAVRLWNVSVAGHVFDFVTMATYHCCVVIWLVYSLAPETARRSAKELPENTLEQWNAELQRLLLQ